MIYKKGMPVRIKVREESGMYHCYLCGLFINESMTGTYNGKCTTVERVTSDNRIKLHNAGGWVYCPHILEPLDNEIREDMGL